MRVLVTGAAGFIGRHLMEALVEAGHHVVGADDLSGAFEPLLDWEPLRAVGTVGRPLLLKTDLRSLPETEVLLRSFEPELIYHLAANAREGASQFQPVEVAERNLGAYVNVLQAAIATGKLKRVVLFSSMAVYGAQPTPFDEEMALSPQDVYGVCKAAMERTTTILADVHDFQWTIVRPHNVYGPGQTLRDRFRNVIAIFMNRIMRGEPVTVYGDGEQLRAFSYIEDSLPAYVRAGLRDEAAGQIINIGGKNPRTINSLLDVVRRAMAERGFLTPSIEHAPERPREVKRAWCRWERSERLLGYTERWDLEIGVEAMAEWACARGPQAWSAEELPLINEKTPRAWLPAEPERRRARG